MSRVLDKAIAVGACLLIACGQPSGAEKKAHEKASTNQSCEGPINSAQIVVGPFDLHRKYQTMYGPYVIEKFQLSDLVSSGRTIVPESKVTFIEGSSVRSSTPPTQSAVVEQKGTQKRELLWFKGIKVQVLDENDHVLPTAEFLCHVAIDVNTAYRNKVFPVSERSGNGRIITLTQGQTDFYFPEGFAVPVASNETWTFTLQATNQTTTHNRRIKHLCTVSFIRDSELTQPIKAMTWNNPYIAVLAKDENHPSNKEAEHTGVPDCHGLSVAESAPNKAPGADFKDSLGRRLATHWVVPPGLHKYRGPIVEERDPGFAASDRLIHAVWTHVHPLCTDASLVMCDGSRRKKLFTVKAKTSTASGLEIKQITNILSKKGIPLLAGHQYEIQSTYNNTTQTPQDSMVEFGIFFQDDKFVRPNWTSKGEIAHSANSSSIQSVAKLEDGRVTCSGTAGDGSSEELTNSSFCENSASYPPYNVSTDTSHNVVLIPLFDPKVDGPLLAELKRMEITTSAGKLHIELDPAVAPQHATQLYKLLKVGLFNGTPICSYQPGYLLQIGQAEAKVDEQPLLSDQSQALLKRLPLEVTSLPVHKKWSLSMARFDDPNSAVTSFSILLADAQHLDGQYTVFGRLITDSATLETIKHITEHWSKQQPWITGVKEMDSSIASGQPSASK